MTIAYKTRDGSGNDITKDVEIKEFPRIAANFTCPTCGHESRWGIDVKKAVSGNFTDWAFVGKYICPDCAKLLSLYFYNYTMEDSEIHLFNVREIYGNLMRPHKTPFKFIVSTSQKKHLFYRAPENCSDDRFAVQLEMETIYTDRDRMRELFDFVECMQTLGASKGMMLEGKLPMEIALSMPQTYQYLRHELETSREIQIPLYCGQKRDIAEEEAKCIINLTLTTATGRERHS